MRSRDVQTTVTDLQKVVAEKIEIASWLLCLFGGTFENLQAAKKRLLMASAFIIVINFYHVVFCIQIYKI